MFRIATIVGARPQFVKAAAVSRILREKYSGKIKEFLVHTGQHYDKDMSEVFFRELDLPRPYRHLGIGSGLHGEQTGKMLIAVEEILLRLEPDLVLVYGDTNSTLAGAIAAAKLNLPIAHVEAGLRSFNNAMPEEHNRKVTDHLSALLFCPTRTAVENLRKEGVSSRRDALPLVMNSGDVMWDMLLRYEKKITVQDKGRKNILDRLGICRKKFVLATLHRPSNTDSPRQLFRLLRMLGAISRKGYTVILPLHPRTRHKMESRLSAKQQKTLRAFKALHIIPPVPYLDMIRLEKHSSLILTDSGGVQKESFFFRKPCITLRKETEWVELVKTGNSKLTGSDPRKILSAFSALTNKKSFPYPSFYGKGNAAKKITREIFRYLRKNTARGNRVL